MQQERRIDIEQLQLKFENGIFFKLSTSTNNARRTSGSLSNDFYCWCIIIWKNNKGKNMVRLTGPYRYTDQPSVCTEPYQYINTLYDKVYRQIGMYHPYQSPVRLLCTAHTGRSVMVWQTSQKFTYSKFS